MDFRRGFIPHHTSFFRRLKSSSILEYTRRFAIPKPFSRINIVVGEPIYVPADIDEEQQKAYMEKLDTALAYGRPDFEYNET